MTAPNLDVCSGDIAELLPRTLPRIRLHHGEAIWVLARLGFQGAAPRSTFYEYIKSLRKIGTPFDRHRNRSARRGLADYLYGHLMELALVLSLRVYHAVPDSVLAEVIQSRETLYRFYRRAYSERMTGIGAAIVLEAAGRRPICLRGAFLDLKIEFNGGKLQSFGPPKLLSPFEAISVFAQRDVAARALLPINLSGLSERLVSVALHAPLIRRGPFSETVADRYLSRK
jgi:hypothetical protein